MFIRLVHDSSCCEDVASGNVSTLYNAGRAARIQFLFALGKAASVRTC